MQYGGGGLAWSVSEPPGSDEDEQQLRRLLNSTEASPPAAPCTLDTMPSLLCKILPLPRCPLTWFSQSHMLTTQLCGSNLRPVPMLSKVELYPSPNVSFLAPDGCPGLANEQCSPRLPGMEHVTELVPDTWGLC